MFVIEPVPKPAPAPGEVLVRVSAARVGPWDRWVRAAESVLSRPLPLTLDADIAGTVKAIGARVSGPSVGDAVFGVSNARFDGWLCGVQRCVGRHDRPQSRLRASS
ncbi:MAG: alcohol dehydrogenase catalytic domain-containing protein [Solirubrobacteraceae bacterium]